MQNESSGSQIIRFGTFELDVRGAELRKQGVRIKLQELPLRILEMLLARPGQLVTREELCNRLWPSDTLIDFDHSLNKAVNKLREALGDNAETPRFIETIPKRGYRFMPGPVAEATPIKIKSLVVLPLENLSQDPEQGYFADGLTEALTTTLAKISALRVLSRTTAAHCKRLQKTPPQIAEELGVDGVVEGAVLRSDGRVRISVQLLHAPTDSHLWAESYDRDMRDILTLQTEVVGAIARQIQAKLTPPEIAQLAQARRVVKPDAYEAYLMARHYWGQRTPEGLKKGAEYFRHAIDKDPTFAPAYAGLADMAASAGFWGLAPPEEAAGKAKVLARKSLEIDETGEARAALAWATLLYDYDCASAEKEFQRALALYPDYAFAHMWYGHCLSCAGRLEEGLAESRRAVQLDPLSLITHVCYEAVVWFLRDWDRCIDQCRSALEINPNFSGVRWMLANALQSKGNHEDAIRERKRVVEAAPNSVMFLAELGDSYAAANMKNEALGIIHKLNDLRADKYVMAYWMALIYTGLRERDEAFRWLDGALHERSAQLAYVSCDPRWDSLRADPRFDDLLVRMRSPHR